ncbi:MAG: ABC transporter permease subunit [Planctomycetota bacterium]|nr:ABC transporter permease subunit [Planctomycetota bacterium]
MAEPTEVIPIDGPGNAGGSAAQEPAHTSSQAVTPPGATPAPAPPSSQIVQPIDSPHTSHAQAAAPSTPPRTTATVPPKGPAAVPASSVPAGPSEQTQRRRAGIAQKDALGLGDRIFLAIDNPVLRRELLTALRSQKAFVLHFFFLLILGMVIFFAWPEGEVSIQDLRARTLFFIFGVSQLIMICVLSPAFSASCITIEKEQRCIDLLLTSPIHPNTILMGKYLSSVLYIFLLVISTAPVASVIGLWMPGIDPYQVAGLYVLLISIAACFGMVGLTCSTFFHRTQTSLSITYLIVLPMALVFLVMSRTFDNFFALNVSIWPSAVLMVASAVMYQSSARRLRQPFDPVFKAAEEEDISTQTGLVLVRDRFPDNLLAPPKTDELLPDGTNPIFQKEIRSEILGRGTLFLRLIIQISMFLSVVFLTFLYLQKEHVFVDYLVVFTMLVAPAFASTTFTQERERGTLDLLMTTLIKPGQIIVGKFLSCCRLSFFLTGLIGITLLFYLLVGYSQAGGGAGFIERCMYFGVYILILAVTIVLETSLGMFLSMISRSTMQSMILTYTSVLLIFGAPVAARALMLLTMPENTFNQYKSQVDWACFTSPFQAVYSVTVKTVGSSQAVEMQSMIWPAYVAFAVGLSVLLLGYIYFSFESWATATQKAR